MPDTPVTAPVTAAVEGELRLLDPAVRADPALVGELLHPEFLEFGASGQRWTREAIIDALATEDDGLPISAAEMKGTLLAPELVHLAFDTECNGRRVHRSSLWRRTGDAWRLWFHQGTPFSADESAGSDSGAS
ncbi:DUF4440 domain-containing protein [Streptomyces formicae]|uniref:Nuclear transport factor 2 family protein n=1 Tax=Streptomyces formicae TaxID=1616117 RepID=A0ABY3WHB6_9ACTN|nr:nuclear transport factor 2 family protein [Streptomyces formicae]UNM11974.1 nuclear transport factor 2 family protein [Streptomyces formicae]